ncbi:MAG: D-alanyl-D-alanine carboxypeptidase [Acidobacteria bacterium]|nr:D-alanyl-D-alanine carboxypeptidase [Acidobacteriota bacterium]
MNSRKPIYAMLAGGLVAILILTFTPYALLSSARHAVATAVQPIPDSVYLQQVEPPTATPRFDVADWYAAHGEDPARHAMLVESMDGQHVFAEHNADATFNPASLVKLTTSLVALRQLGKEYRFETRVYIEGTTDNSGVLHGRLIVAGNDPTFGDMSAVKLAQELEKRGVKKVADEIVVTPGFSFNYSEKPEESAERMAKVMKLTPKKYSIGDAPSSAALFVLRSYPLRAILLYMNAHSVNFVAEHLGAMVGGPEGVRRFIVEELKLPADQIWLSTTSGLEHNQMTARGLLAVIRALNAEANRQGLKLEDILAVASDDWGTLRKRLVGTPLEGAVVGKTGTLVHDDGGMASLGGVVYTQKNGLVFFVVFNQGSGVAASRALTDELLVQVVLSQDIPAAMQKSDEAEAALENEAACESGGGRERDAER